MKMKMKINNTTTAVKTVAILRPKKFWNSISSFYRIAIQLSPMRFVPKFFCRDYVRVLLLALIIQPVYGGSNQTPISVLKATEEKASQPAKRILQMGRKMVFETQEIIRGGCWNYINTVYNRAGFDKQHRYLVHKGKKPTGPYVALEKIQSGDWLYYINHSYHDVEHSGIFIRWVDRQKHIGEILSYAGESRKRPGRYRNYDLSHVYSVIRAKP